MIGTVLNGRYRLDAELGRGGMGVVYRARDTLLDREVAVKVLSSPQLTVDGRARLLREAQAAAQLNHPNVVSVYDAGEAELPAAGGTVPYVVMELVAGPSLHERRPATLQEILAIAVQVCAALEHAHSHGIVHRDLKPENVLLATGPAAGEGSTAKLADLGLARTAASRLTVEGTLLGTAFYVAPEQALGQEIDGRADLYALGVMLYELTAGRLPFSGDDALAVIGQHLYSSVVPPRTHVPDLPPALDALIVQLLSKHPGDRPASAAAVQLTLAAIARAETPSSPPAVVGPGHNLPVPATPFVGRSAQVAAVRDALARPEVRLLTLTGTGGTGKTRLALEVAGGLLDRFPDGVWFVALAAVRDPALVPSAIAQALGVREAADRPVLEQIKDHLRGQQMLLVLDNMEQVVEAAPAIGELLAAAPGLRVLVTSRAVLRVYGEHDYPVPPLALPDLEEPPALERLAANEAVQLFLQRAQAAQAGFALTGANAPDVVAICRQLDGLPLALELAAARMRLLSPQAMVPQLDHRLRLLTGGPRDQPARHQTLRAAIGWSYDLLNPQEQVLFRRLAAFCCRFTLASAEAVCDPAGELDVLRGLEGLVDQSLVQAGRGAAEPEFSMLTTIREYALEQLAASDAAEAPAVRQRHVAYFAALAEEANVSLSALHSGKRAEQLELEHDNLRAALEWSLEQGEQDELAAETGLRLAGALWYFWYLRAHLNEGRRWLARALACPLGGGHARARVLGAAGTFAWLQGDYGEARPYLEQAVAAWRELGDRAGLAEAAHLLGHLALDERRHGEAHALFAESLGLYQEQGDRFSESVLTQDLALLAYHQGAYAEARAGFEAFLATARLLDEHDWMCETLSRLGELAHLRGDDQEAEALFKEGLALSQEFHLNMEMPALLKNLGHIARQRGDPARARALFAESLALQREHGNKQGMAESLAGLASVAAAPERAAQLFAAVEALLSTMGAPLSPADRADLERCLAAVRAHLDQVAFAAAWAAGQALAGDGSPATWERIIALALETPGA